MRRRLPLARSPQPPRPTDEAGFTLVELVVALSLMMGVIIGFYLVFVGISRAGVAIQVATSNQETSRLAVRVLEADVRSADPLVLVPSTFHMDPNGASNVGRNGTTPTDIVAMYEVNEGYWPCTTSVNNPPVPSPFVIAPPAANLVWAFDPVAHTLTRYSYCSAGWTAGLVLRNVTDTSATMFRVAQDDSSSLLPQQQTPTSTTVVNQSTPVCGRSLTVIVTVHPPKQGTSFTVSVSLPLENQAFVWTLQGC